MSVPRSGRRGKYEERPASCRVCGAGAWWNGRRIVAAVVCGVAAVAEHVTDRVRRRARCSDRRCAAGSWTVHTGGDYPHRTFQIDVVSSAVMQASLEGRGAAAQNHLCSRRSLGRWLRWSIEFLEPERLAKLVARLDGDGLPPPRGGGQSLEERASWAVRLWERLVELLEARGVLLPRGRCGLQRLLCWQRERHGVVAWLTKAASPRLHVEVSDLLV